MEKDRQQTSSSSRPAIKVIYEPVTSVTSVKPRRGIFDLLVGCIYSIPGILLILEAFFMLISGMEKGIVPSCGCFTVCLMLFGGAALTWKGFLYSVVGIRRMAGLKPVPRRWHFWKSTQRFQ